MVQMVKVLEGHPPDTGFLAEVPGRPGRFVHAESLPELKSKLRTALTDPDSQVFATSSRRVPRSGFSDTAIYVTL